MEVRKMEEIKKLKNEWTKVNKQILEKYKELTEILKKREISPEDPAHFIRKKLFATDAIDLRMDYIGLMRVGDEFITVYMPRIELNRIDLMEVDPERLKDDIYLALVLVDELKPTCDEMRKLLDESYKIERKLHELKIEKARERFEQWPEVLKTIECNGHKIEVRKGSLSHNFGGKLEWYPSYYIDGREFYLVDYTTRDGRILVKKAKRELGIERWVIEEIKHLIELKKKELFSIS